MFFNHRSLKEHQFRLGPDGKEISDEKLKTLTIMYTNESGVLFSTKFSFGHDKKREKSKRCSVSLTLNLDGDVDIPLSAGTGTGGTYVEASQDLEKKFNELVDDASRPALAGLLKRAGELTPVTT